VVSGRCDPWLEEILSVVAERSRYVRQREAFERLRTLKEGDTVRVIGNIKPKYLVGQRGTVVALSDIRRRGFPMVEVDFGKPIRRYGAIITMPVSCLQVVPEQQELL
jgi:hypothetical protein